MEVLSVAIPQTHRHSTEMAIVGYRPDGRLPFLPKSFGRLAAMGAMSIISLL